MATINCFTSTGNSLYTANKIADKIGGKVLSMRGEPTVCDDHVIGFVFPCFFWGIPRMVQRFVSKVQIINKDVYVFAVMNCGGPVFGALGLLKKALKQKNIRLRYGSQIISVTNYLPEYNAKDSETLRQKTAMRIEKIADDIMYRRVKRMPSLSLHNRLMYKFYPGENSDRDFSITQLCTGCATCRKACPADNIIIKAGKPAFQHKCEHCLACLHICPTHAINWKDKTQGKERYRNAKVSLEDLIGFNSR